MWAQTSAYQFTRMASLAKELIFHPGSWLRRSRTSRSALKGRCARVPMVQDSLAITHLFRIIHLRWEVLLTCTRTDAIIDIKKLWCELKSRPTKSIGSTKLYLVSASVSIALAKNAIHTENFLYIMMIKTKQQDMFGHLGSTRPYNR